MSDVNGVSVYVVLQMPTDRRNNLQLGNLQAWGSLLLTFEENVDVAEMEPR